MSIFTPSTNAARWCGRKSDWQSGKVYTRNEEGPVKTGPQADGAYRANSIGQVSTRKATVIPQGGHVKRNGYERTGYTVQTPVLVATQWLHATTKEKARYRFDSGLSLSVLVGTERFELSTYGLRVRCSTS